MATAWTATNSDILSPEVQFVLTSTTAASAIDVTPGFAPRKIHVLDTTTGNEALWVKGMPVANSLTTAGATGNVTAATTNGFGTVGTTVTVPSAIQPAAGVTIVTCSR